MAYNHTTGDGDRIFSPMYADVWEENLKGMNGSDVKVYIALLMHTTQHDRTWFMSIDELAEDAGVSRSTASAAKDRLVESGLVVQAWRYRDEAGDYHLTDTRPPPRLQGKNVYKVNVRPGADRVRKSEPIESENRNLVESENRNQTIAPSPQPPPEPLSPLAPQGADDASVAEEGAQAQPSLLPETTTPAAPSLTDEFDTWWQQVPRKKAKADARKAFKAARKKATLQQLVDGLEASMRQWQAEGRDVSKIPYPATWLRAESWLDEHDQWQAPQQQRRVWPEELYLRDMQARTPTTGDHSQPWLNGPDTTPPWADTPTAEQPWLGTADEQKGINR